MKKIEKHACNLVYNDISEMVLKHHPSKMDETINLAIKTGINIVNFNLLSCGWLTKRYCSNTMRKEAILAMLNSTINESRLSDIEKFNILTLAEKVVNGYTAIGKDNKLEYQATHDIIDGAFKLRYIRDASPAMIPPSSMSEFKNTKCLGYITEFHNKLILDLVDSIMKRVSVGHYYGLDRAETIAHSLRNELCQLSS